ncbi:MAG: hypothetical protein HYY23_20890 [Verrucomicrobia bacterium]|nr:hypothetical protein [Verrucomicrobiota bacterium]
MLTCWVYRQKISESLDAGHALPRTLPNHLQSCRSCRDFYEAGLQINELLASGAGRERVSSPPFLQGKILTALNDSREGPHPGRIRLAWAATAFAVAAVLVGAWFLWHQPPLQPQPQPVVRSGQNPGQAAEWFAAAARLPSEDTLLEWGQKLDQPLETELKSVLHDARKALASLAQNFLPDELSPLP